MLVNIVFVVFGSYFDTAVHSSAVDVEVLLVTLHKAVLTLDSHLRGVIGGKAGGRANSHLPIVELQVAVLVINGNGLSSLIHFGLVVEVCIVLILRCRGSCPGSNRGIEDLASGLVLVSLDVQILLIGDNAVLTKANAVVGVVAVGVKRAILAHRILATLDDVLARLKRKGVILQEGAVTDLLHLAAVPEIPAQLLGQRESRTCGSVQLVGIRGAIRRAEGGNDGKQDQEGDNDTANHSSLVLAEAAERIL